MTTTKRDLALMVSKATGEKKSQSAVLVDALFRSMCEELIAGNRIEVRGFGVFEVKDTKAKSHARNPKTGETIYVPARRKTHFKPGLLLKKELHKPIEKGGKRKKR